MTTWALQRKTSYSRAAPVQQRSRLDQEIAEPGLIRRQIGRLRKSQARPRRQMRDTADVEGCGESAQIHELLLGAQVEGLKSPPAVGKFAIGNRLLGMVYPRRTLLAL